MEQLTNKNNPSGVTMPASDDAQLFEELKAVLLAEDRKALQHLQDILDEPNKLSPKILPILEERLIVFKESFPKEYRAILERIISEKLANSKEELLEAIYPIVGKLIKKYIALQFDLLRENINNKTKFSFWGRVKTKSKSIMTGVSSEEIILDKLNKVTIENIFVIQKDSGLLIASAKNDPDNDVIAGMMTAIKAFAEDAFHKSGADLEEINYGEYKLLLESYYSYYFVVAVSGLISMQQNIHIHEIMNTFAAQNLSRRNVKDGQYSIAISIKLKEAFINNLKES